MRRLHLAHALLPEGLRRNVSLTLDEEGMTDTFEDQDGDRALDLVGSVDDSMLQWASDGTTLWWRVRLNEDPTAAEGA